MAGALEKKQEAKVGQRTKDRKYTPLESFPISMTSESDSLLFFLVRKSDSHHCQSSRIEQRFFALGVFMVRLNPVGSSDTAHGNENETSCIQIL